MDGCKFLLLLFIPASIYYLFLKFIFKVNYLFLPKSKRVMWCTALCWWITHFVTPWPWCCWKSLNGTCSHIWTWLINYESVSHWEGSHLFHSGEHPLYFSLPSTSLLSLRNSYIRGFEDCKSQKRWMSLRKQRVPDTTRLFSYKFTETVAVFTRPAQVQYRWGPSIERGGRNLNPNQEAVSSTTDTWWKREKISFW